MEIVQESLSKIQTVRITEMAQLQPLIVESEYNPHVKHYRSSCLYRGLPNIAFELKTSLQRNCGAGANKLEKSILRNFAKYAATDQPSILNSDWEKMVIGQHHGLPTRLLDWTYSPLVALHFATSGEDISEMDRHDGVVWKIDIEEVNGLLPAKYRDVLDAESAHLCTIDMLERLAKSMDDYDKDMLDQALVLLEPLSIDQRIINQYSYFSITPQKVSCMEYFLASNTHKTVRYVLDKSLRWHIRDMLDQANINERTMYPGLDGLTLWLKRHYFVR